MFFLMVHGDKDLTTIEADSVEQAIQLFKDLGCEAILTDVLLVSPITDWEDIDINLYAASEDGSWFPADELQIIAVPDGLTDADEVEQFITLRI